MLFVPYEKQNTNALERDHVYTILDKGVGEGIPEGLVIELRPEKI